LGGKLLIATPITVPPAHIDGAALFTVSAAAVPRNNPSFTASG
jgi:hypothetical protein